MSTKKTSEPKCRAHFRIRIGMYLHLYGTQKVRETSALQDT